MLTLYLLLYLLVGSNFLINFVVVALVQVREGERRAERDCSQHSSDAAHCPHRL